MSNEQIDHRAEAVHIPTNVDKANVLLSNVPLAGLLGNEEVIAVAQVHATLAVADELREMKDVLKELFFQLQHIANGVNS